MYRDLLLLLLFAAIRDLPARGLLLGRTVSTQQTEMEAQA